MSEVRFMIAAALAEDVGAGDVTSRCLFRQPQVLSGRIVAKEDFVLAGIDVAREVFLAVNDCIIFRSMRKDGDRIKDGDVLAEFTGDVADLLKAERVALNYMQHLSGIATLTSAFVDKIRGSRSKIVDTRKTIPGMRMLEKYAVRAGGGYNHRTGLYDGILIKDNHIAACGGVRNAVTQAKTEAPHTLKVEVEVVNLDQLREAIDAGADIIMLDNMSLEQMREAVQLVAGRAIVEASGNMTLDRVADVAFSGVDIISVGAITQSAPAIDISMRLDSK